MIKPRKNHLDLGKRGEDLVLDYLCGLGYKILGRNLRFSGVEVDILAEAGEMVLVVEVKSRRSTIVHPSRAVDRNKQHRLARAALALGEKYPNRSIRFDVASVINKGEEFKIEYVADAFRPEASFEENSFE